MIRKMESKYTTEKKIEISREISMNTKRNIHKQTQAYTESK